MVSKSPLEWQREPLQVSGTTFSTSTRKNGSNSRAEKAKKVLQGSNNDAKVEDAKRGEKRKGAEAINK